MRKSRGFLTPEILVYGGLAIGVMLAIAAGVWAVNRWEAKIDKQGYERGRSEVIADYAKRDNQQLHEAVTKVKDLEEKMREKEHQYTVDMINIAAERAKEKDNVQKQRDADLAAVRAGTLKLRDPGARASGPAVCDRSQTAQAPATGPVDNGSTGADLSPAATEFLFNLTTEADDITRQLTRAQELILLQYKTCSGG